MRINFLNWRPDAEDVGNDGLTTADNVIHDVEGYRPVHLASASTFATTGGLGATTDDTVLSVVAKPVGAQGDFFCAWVADSTTPRVHVGLNGVTATTTATNYANGTAVALPAAATDAQIWAFDVCEYGGKILWTVEARGTDAGSTAVSVAFAGYMDF